MVLQRKKIGFKHFQYVNAGNIPSFYSLMHANHKLHYLNPLVNANKITLFVIMIF
jgi:hypothetical protein